MKNMTGFGTEAIICMCGRAYSYTDPAVKLNWVRQHGHPRQPYVSPLSPRNLHLVIIHACSPIVVFDVDASSWVIYGLLLPRGP